LSLFYSFLSDNRVSIQVIEVKFCTQISADYIVSDSLKKKENQLSMPLKLNLLFFMGAKFIFLYNSFCRRMCDGRDCHVTCDVELGIES